ncbi:hypothetical protein [Brucella sp. IR073]|uniref:hypothetical protein n=1 Tax=unclassified Brucella TaxID=2632610 RepID=UPI003B9877D7
MNTAYQTTVAGIANALNGLLVKPTSAKRPAPSIHTEALKRAWAEYREWEAMWENEYGEKRTRFHRPQFGMFLRNAYQYFRICARGPVYITDNEARFIGSGSRWR